MKHFLPLLLILACTSHKQAGFKKETHCSQETRELFTGTVVSQDLQIKDLLELKCYTPEAKEVCVAIRLDEVGTVRYLDVSDEVNGLSKEFKSCLLTEIKKMDFKGLKSKNGLDIIQSMNFSPSQGN